MEEREFQLALKPDRDPEDQYILMEDDNDEGPKVHLLIRVPKEKQPVVIESIITEDFDLWHATLPALLAIIPNNVSIAQVLEQASKQAGREVYPWELAGVIDAHDSDQPKEN